MRREDRNWLVLICERTDNPDGKFKGIAADRPPADVVLRLVKTGMVETFNPGRRYLLRLIITDAGRTALTGDKEIVP